MKKTFLHLFLENLLSFCYSEVTQRLFNNKKNLEIHPQKLFIEWMHHFEWTSPCEVWGVLKQQPFMGRQDSPGRDIVTLRTMAARPLFSGTSFRIRAWKYGAQLGSNKGAIRQHMLTIWNYVNIKEAWEGLQGAGDTRNGSFQVPHEALAQWFHLPTTALISGSRSSSSNKHSQLSFLNKLIG